MEHISSEIFGHFVYDESLTYEELLHVEDNFISSIENLLLRAEAEHIDFMPLGDALMFQCDFTGHKLYIFRKLACELATLLPDKISGRMCCLSHDLEACHLYWLRPNEWQEQSIAMPQIAPQDLKTWKVAKS